MTNSPGGYEKKDENFKAIISLTVVLLVVVAGAALFTWFLDHWLRVPGPVGTRPVSPLAEFHRRPPEPRLQVNDAVDMVRMRDETQKLLSTYGWLDTEAGRVRIPIDRAIEIMAQRGLPTQEKLSAKERR